MNVAGFFDQYSQEIVSITDDLERVNRICEIAFEACEMIDGSSSFLIEFSIALEAHANTVRNLGDLSLAA